MPLKKYPYGYEMKNGEIIISEEEAKYVKYIFNSYISGKSMYSISIELFNNDTPYFNDTKKRSGHKVNAILRDDAANNNSSYRRAPEQNVTVVLPSKEEIVVEQPVLAEEPVIMEQPAANSGEEAALGDYLNR